MMKIGEKRTLVIPHDLAPAPAGSPRPVTEL